MVAKNGFNKSWIIWGVLGLFVLYMLSAVNTIPALDEKVDAKWSDTLNQYKRRADLVPNLVNTVKGAADFEQETLENVIKARQQVTQINANNLLSNPEAFAQFEQAQSGLSSALSRLLVTVERYPQLTATQNFAALQSQLEGTENRIAVARRDYIDAVREFNTEIRTFPGVVLNMLYGLEKKPNFAQPESIQETPAVKF